MDGLLLLQVFCAGLSCNVKAGAGPLYLMVCWCSALYEVHQGLPHVNVVQYGREICIKATEVFGIGFVEQFPGDTVCC